MALDVLEAPALLRRSFLESAKLRLITNQAIFLIAAVGRTE